MKNKLLQTLFVFFIITNSIAQERTLVFDKKGKIIKNYGFDAPTTEGLEFRILIDEITEEEKPNYFILYQWRNHYNFEANIIGSNNTLRVLKYDKKGINYTFDEIKNNARYFNYWLVEANKEGKKYLSSISNDKTKTLQLNVFLKQYETTLHSIVKNYIDTNANGFDSYLMALDKNKKSIEAYQKLAEKFKKKESLEDKEKEKLTTTLASKKEIITNLTKITHAATTPKYIADLGNEIVKLNEKILLKTRLIKDSVQLVNDSIKKITKRNTELVASMQNIIFKNDTSKEFIKKPLYKVLHQGILLSKTKDIHEIVYDINNNENLNAKNKQLEVARLTPTLPQLTTTSQLYAHIINFTPDLIKNTPFKISMLTSQNDSVAVESVSNFKGMEAIDDISNGLLSDIIGGIVAVKSENITEENTSSDTTAIAEKIIKKIESKTINKNNVTQNLIKDVAYYAELNVYSTEANGFLADEKKDFPSQKDTAAFLKFDHESFFKKNILQKLIQNEQEKNKKIKKILGLISLKQTNTPNYTEYILKYPKPFKANSAPTINLYTNQLNIENYVKKVEDGKVKEPSYDITYASKLLVSDELPPTHRLYRFTLTAGALWTSSKSYELDVNNTPKEIDNSGVKPSITFSTYLKNQDLNVDASDWLTETIHFDISIDYEDANITDNFYFGFGVEPIRNLHLGMGYRFGKTDKMVNQEVERVKNNGMYITASLGFNLIPSMLKYLF
ncbi:hypothetical protein [Polaribacter sp. Z022]|uniref:hypothetical protein n=1 Tax=Polaribacter sp. Z022 TaxID=2927125 RepID=UPI0020211BF9|nr:hypothetical protein [Polaribacter sp. Z022]MCL7755130.1 hypothetical protein [Polaribacter sp. Z022]